MHISELSKTPICGKLGLAEFGLAKVRTQGIEKRYKNFTKFEKEIIER